MSQTGGAYTFTDLALGGHIAIDSFHLAYDTTGSLVLAAHVTITKSPSPNDSLLPYFDVRDVSMVMELDASNGHPYYFAGAELGWLCDESPGFIGDEVHNGDVISGWMCTLGLPHTPQGQYTIKLTLGAGQALGDIIISPLLNVTIP